MDRDEEAAEGIRPWCKTEDGRDEIVIVSPSTWSRNEEMPDGWEETKNDLSQYRVGQEIVRRAAAPGIGRWVYRVTRIDDWGVWGVLEEDTVRVMEPWETE